MNDEVKIDGSYGEGGGQIIRTSLSLSALTGKPVTIDNVRARRSRPGLQPQHLTAVQAAARICNAALDGAEVGSKRFTFRPSSPVQPGRYAFDIGTAGATSLVMQTVMIPLALAGTANGPADSTALAGTANGRADSTALSGGASQVTIGGGTHVSHAPTAHYLEHVYAEVMRAQGLGSTLSIPAAGFFPRGGGKIETSIEPSTLAPVDLVERGRLRQLTAYIVTSELPEKVAERGAATASKALGGFKKPAVVPVDLPSRGPGASVVVIAECDNVRAGFSSIGERGKPMETVTLEACDQFAEWYRSGAACDEHLADQLVLPAALAMGESRWSTSAVTEHLRTVLWLTRHFLPGVETHLEERADGTGFVRISSPTAKAGGWGSCG